jgi:hypothetical protein
MVSMHLGAINSASNYLVIYTTVTYNPYNRHIANNSTNTDCGSSSSSTSSCSTSISSRNHFRHADRAADGNNEVNSIKIQKCSRGPPA